MASLHRLSFQLVTDNYGAPNPGARLFVFEANTTTPLTVYSDPELTTPRTHPVLADGNGRWPAIFLPYTDYRERVTLASGVLLWDAISIPNPAPVTSGGGSVDPLLLYQTGDTVWRPENSVRAGFVRLNGRTIGNASSGATERANADTAGLFSYLWSALANAEAPVSGGRGGSAVSDYAAGKTLTLPDGRRGALFGLYGMGNTTLTPATGATVGSGKENVPGAVIGAEAHTLDIAQMPNHNHTGTTGSGGAQNVAGGTGITGTQSFASLGGSSPNQALTGTATLTVANHTHTIPSQGGGTAHNNLPPGLLGTFYMKL